MRAGDRRLERIVEPHDDLKPHLLSRGRPLDDLVVAVAAAEELGRYF
jgi:hypothetical protein